MLSRLFVQSNILLAAANPMNASIGSLRRICVVGNPPSEVGALQRIDHRFHLAAVVLSEELHFDRAAQRLEIPVSELKDQIAQLENKLSMLLFEQGSDSLQMTASGQLYIEQIRKSRFL
jgi:hypothetical protein